MRIDNVVVWLFGARVSLRIAWMALCSATRCAKMGRPIYGRCSSQGMPAKKWLVSSKCFIHLALKCQRAARKQCCDLVLFFELLATPAFVSQARTSRVSWVAWNKFVTCRVACRRTWLATSESRWCNVSRLILVASCSITRSTLTLTWGTFLRFLIIFEQRIVCQ